MIQKPALLALLLFLPLAALAADKPDDFAIISQRNMFLRDRQPPPEPWVPRAPTTQESRPIDPPAKSFVLRGVVIDDNELHAYVEDTRGGSVVRLTPGDAVADGHIASIAIDAIAYEQNGLVRWIDVGQNLIGNTVAPTTAPATTAPATDGGANSITATPASPALSALEQRMRERRMRTNQRTTK